MNRKRGQAAMEFLMTYGWALLVVLVAIGALAFFGVLNPGQFLPASCQVMPGIGCIEFKIQATAGADGEEITLRLQNGLGDQISITNINITSSDTSVCQAGTGTASGGLSGGGSITECTTAAPCNINDGATANVLFDCAGLTQGEKFKGTITVDYTTGTSTLSHRRDGQIVAPVEN